jgi:hypothetical protein
MAPCPEANTHGSILTGTAVRKISVHTKKGLIEAMGRALAAVSAEDVRGFFTHCGYRTPAHQIRKALYGKDLRVRERRGGSACSEASEILETVVYEAEGGYDGGVKIHESKDLLLASVGLGTTERREVSLSIQLFGEACIQG